MIRLDKMFKIVNGVPATSLNILDSKTSEEVVSFRRPSKTFKGTQAGFVKIRDVSSDKVFNRDTIMVSTDGEGSHSYAYVVNTPFIPNSNVCALVPKEELSLVEKMFYAKCITMNRPLFSYGRKPKGERLAKIMIPSKEEIPSWVYEMEINDYSDIGDSKETGVVLLPTLDSWKSFSYEQLFKLERGQGPTASSAKKSPGSNPYIGASSENNGVTQYTDFPCCHSGNTITIANNGSVGEAFYQGSDYLASSDVTVLEPLFKMNAQVGLFLSTLIRAEKYRYNYGRKWGISRMKTSTIKVPVDKDGNIDTELITRYMNSLSYSKYL